MCVDFLYYYYFLGRKKKKIFEIDKKRTYLAQIPKCYHILMNVFHINLYSWLNLWRTHIVARRTRKYERYQHKRKQENWLKKFCTIFLIHMLTYAVFISLFLLPFRFFFEVISITNISSFNLLFDIFVNKQTSWRKNGEKRSKNHYLIESYKSSNKISI